MPITGFPPPDSVYNLGGFDSTDGVSMDWQTDIGNLISTVTVLAGRGNTTLKAAIPGQADAELDSRRNVIGVWNLNYDWLTLRIIHSESDVLINSSDFDQLAFGLSNYGVSEDDISSMLLDSDDGHFDGVGLSIDTGAFFAVAEYTESGTDDSFASDATKSWYVSGGARFGDFTAYATVENRKSDANTELLNSMTASIDATVAGTQFALDNDFIPGTVDQVGASLLILGAPDLKAGISQIFNLADVEQDTYSVGLRYNFHPSATAKIEYMMQDDHVTDKKPEVIAVAIDLIY